MHRLELLKQLTQQLRQTIPPLNEQQSEQLQQIENNLIALIQSSIEETALNRGEIERNRIEIERLKETLDKGTLVVPVTVNPSIQPNVMALPPEESRDQG